MKQGGLTRCRMATIPMLFTMMFVACIGADVPNVRSPLVSDSAGIAVYVHPEQGFGDPSGEGVRTLDRVFRVGWEDQGPQFANINRGRILRDGRTLIFDSGEFLVLDTLGQIAERFGGEGEGPGEFSAATALHVLPSDSIVVYDDTNRRVSILSPAFEFVRSYPWSRMVSVPGAGLVLHRPSGITDSGLMIWTPFAYSIRSVESELQWVAAPVFAGPRMAGSEDSIVSLPFVQVRSEEGRVVSYPFGPTGWISGHPEGIVWAPSDRSELRWFSESGELTRIARWSTQPIAVDDGVWAEYSQAYLSSVVASGEGGQLDAARSRLAERRGRAAAHLPLFGSLLVGTDGAVWLGEYVFPGGAAHQYLRIDAFGEEIGEVRAPWGFEVLDGRDDLVLGVERNELDVDAIGLYRIGG